MLKKTLAIGIAALSMAGTGFGLSTVPAAAAPWMTGHHHHHKQICKVRWHHHHKHVYCFWI